MKWVLPPLLLLLSCFGLHARPEVKHLMLAPTAEMQRAELYVWKPEAKVQGVMVFCPGHNGSGEQFANSAEWQQFARENALALCGLSFASDMSVTKDSRGYSRAERGSGKLLLDALKKELEGSEPPLLLYGYSAGARFTTSFLAWKPERVGGWCASGVGTWPSLPEAEPCRKIPGIVACGEYDAACYWSSLHYFQGGRERLLPWTWVSLEGLGHGYSSVLDQFVVRYFSLLMKQPRKAANSMTAAYFDIATKQRLKADAASDSPIFSTWLPADEALLRHWTQIHHP